jgi:hypothetical protein
MKIEATDHEGVSWEFEVSLDLQANPQRILFRAGDLLRTTHYSHSVGLEALSQEEVFDYFRRSILTMKVEQIRNYSRGKHRFFDELVSFLAAFGSLATALRFYAGETPAALGPRQGIGFQGTHVSNLSLTYVPGAVLSEIAQNRLPTTIQMVEQPRTAIPPEDPSSLTSVGELSISLIGSALIRYYESVIPIVRKKFGTDSTNWPGVWNFGRVIRNALAHHGGRVNFDNPRAQPVSWKSLTFSPADNGRQIMFVDIATVEIILLMEDMDATV